jgi:hypothetical protein
MDALLGYSNASWNVVLEKELNGINMTNSQMQIALEEKVDLSSIEQFAKEKLGMQRPDKFQINYINLQKTDYTEIPNETAEIANTDIRENILSKKVSDIIGNLF